MAKALFDVAAKFKVTVPSPEGPKSVTVSFPSDEQWVARSRKRKWITKQLGRGASEMVPIESEESDLELVNQLRLDGGDPEISAADATFVLDQLNRCEVSGEAVFESGSYRVVLLVPGSTTIHTMSMPSADALMNYRRSVTRNIDLGNSKQQMTINLEAAGGLYRKIQTAVDGYAGAVPVVHQGPVIAAIVLACQKMETPLGGGDDSEDFQ
jgi:hypothetical protein